ncbi:SDR family NAD(P)-dependent oxidoreductase [Cnuibacter sp. UC19_7]|uniref:SDR family NAD(P)-dependent oxidoreductase n=1 Tax=Cnuibacter sp. UC19_7 TaxID=3350166 RepID=UPI00366B1742
MGERVVVVTGASSGIGRVVASRLADDGDTVAIVGRNAERTRAVAAQTGGRAFIADFDRLDDVRRLAAELQDAYDHVDVLMNNAGGLVGTRSLTADGHERTLQSNHLAPYLLTRLLQPALERGTDARVVSTASVANRFGRVDLDDLEYERRPWRKGWTAYGQVKLATILFIKELARRWAPLGIDAFSVHPGAVATGFGTDSGLIRFANIVTRGHYGLTPEAGAVPLYALASSAPVPAASGAYFDRLRANGATALQATDQDLQAALWARTAEMVGLDPE